MTIGEAVKKYSKIEIELLLAHVFRESKEFVFLHPEYKLTIKQLNNLTELVKRRQKGEPIAYIIGYKDFYGLRFKVNKNVLIPRSETEMVVDLVIERFKDLMVERWEEPVKILDVGTGSGCIIIALARKLQTTNCKLEFYASDISAKALTVARQNARANHVKIKFVKSDLLDDITFAPDVVIANLPYLDNRWKTDSIKCEPRGALFAKEGGLYVYRKLLSQLITRNSQPSLLYFEIDPRQKSSLRLLVEKYLPKSKLTFHKDPASRWRYAEISL